MPSINRTRPRGSLSRGPALALLTAALLLWLSASPAGAQNPPSVSLSVSPNPATEGSPVAVTVTLSAPLASDVAIPVTTTRVSSEAGDHGALSSIPIFAGQTTGMGSISTLLDDDGDDETFSVAIDTAALPSSVAAGDPASQTVTITDIRSSAGLEVRAWPAAPARFAVHAGDGQATLMWDPVNGAVAYQYRLDSGDWVGVGVDTSWIVTGLANGTTYRFQVRGVGLGPEPNGAATAAVAAVPLAPASRSVSLGVAPNPVTEGSPLTVTVTLSKALASNVAVPLTVTRVSSEAGDHGALSSITVTAGQTTGTGTITTHIDTDTGDETFTVALDTAGLPERLTAIGATSRTVTIKDMTLAAPAGLTAEAGDARVTLSWDALTGATAYEVQRDSGGWTAVGAATTHIATGLENGTEYRFRVRAMQRTFAGAATDAVAVTPTTAAPDAPGAVYVTHYGGRLEVRGFHGAARATAYDVEYRASGDAAWTRAATGHAGSGIVTLTVPDSSKSYVVRVRATNDDGASGWTLSAPANSPAPAPVSSVSVRHNGASLRVSWSAAARADRYDVEYQAAGASSWTSAAADHTATSLTISGVDAAKSYTVRVLSKNDSGGAREGTTDRSWTTSATVSRSQRPGLLPVASVAVVHNGSTLSVTWPAAPGAATYRVEASTDGGRTWSGVRREAVESLSLTIHSVSPAVSYTVRVKAYNDDGESGWTSSAAAAPAAPDPPGLRVWPSSGRLVAIVSKGVRAVSVDVEYSSDGGATWTAADRPGVITQIGGLDPDLSYSVRARAGNASGASAWITWTPPRQEQQQTLPAAPDAVASVSVTHSGDTLSASWDAAARAAGYDVEYQAAGASSWTSAATDHTGAGITISGVDGADSYTVRVKAKNAGGEAAWTTSAPAAPAAPAAVASVSVTHSGDSLSVSWDAPARAARYHVAYQVSDASSWRSETPDHTTTSITINGVDPAKSYTVRVKATNAGGAGDWTASASTPAAPGAVASVSLTHGGGALSVSWAAPARATGYDIEYQAGGAGSWTSAATDHAATSLTVGGVDSTASYTVRVRAKNAGGESAWTTSASVTPPLPAPANVTVTESSGRAYVNWDGSAGATGYEYRLKARGADAWSGWWSVFGGGDKSIQLRSSSQRPLEPGADYLVQVRAVQSGNGATRHSAPTAEVGFTMPR